MADNRTCPRFNALYEYLQIWRSCDQNWRIYAPDKVKYEPF